MRILIVEDDEKLAKLLKKLLQKESYSADVSLNGKNAVEKINNNEFDLILLDLGLPDIDGLELAKKIRESSLKTPILMLTGRSSEDDKVAGLDTGADDYLAKPFGDNELLARIRALLRRPDSSLPTVLQVEDLTLDPSNHEVVRNDKHIELMPKEYALLEYLMKRKGEVCTKEELLNHVWGIHTNNTSNRLEVYIRYLREKVDDNFDKKLIITQRGSGYKIG